MSKLIQDIPVLIIGATLAGLGLASKLGKTALVVEKTALLGHEFIDSYNPGEEWHKVVLSMEGESIKRDLMSRGILTEDGKVHIPAVAPVLFYFIKKEKLNFLFMTEVTDIQRLSEGFEVTLHNNSGFQKIKVGKIIDTTSFCISKVAMGNDIDSKRIHAMLHPSNGVAIYPKSFDKGVTLMQGRFPSEVILQYSIDKEDSWVTAREKLHRFWISKGDCLKDWNLATVASTFAIQVQKGVRHIENNWDWVPSCAYTNPLEAFEAGRNVDIKEVEKSC